MATLAAKEFRVGISMACGCSASGTLSINGAPAVVGCGLHSCTEVVESPALTGRTATCSYGNHGATPSSTELAFFEHQPNQLHDRYYCGCRGWN